MEWHGISEYLALFGLVAFVLHAIGRRYWKCTILATFACSIINMAHEAWVADWKVNPGWAPSMLFIGALVALPICALAGLPSLAMRRWRRLS
jgi:hypothetical protein